MKKWTVMLICLILVLTGCSKPAAPSAPAPLDAAAQTGSYQDITDWHGQRCGRFLCKRHQRNHHPDGRKSTAGYLR